MFIEEFDVARLVREVEATVQPLVARKENRLVVECPSDIGRMEADQTKVRQTLFNLISNAAKFTEKGVIRLSVERQSVERQSVERQSASERTGEPRSDASTLPRSTILMRVSDSGIGMTPALPENMVARAWAWR